MPDVLVRFPERLRREFRKAVLKAFPLEEVAILLGNRGPNGEYALDRLYFPPTRLKKSTTENIVILPEWFSDAEAANPGYMVFGDIHSHPYIGLDMPMLSAEPSETDWISAAHKRKHYPGGYHLMGIMTCLEIGKKYVTKTKFWPIGAPVTLVK
jgi:hypothetical protein